MCFGMVSHFVFVRSKNNQPLSVKPILFCSDLFLLQSEPYRERNKVVHANYYRVPQKYYINFYRFNIQKLQIWYIQTAMGTNV